MAKAPVPSKVAWIEPSLEEFLTIRGGYAAKACPVKSYKEVVSGHAEVTFVHIAKQEDWLLNCVCGKAGDRASLKRSSFSFSFKKKLK